MTTNRETVKIEINIAGEHILLSVPFSKQESVRVCEREINTLFNDWRHRYPRKSTTELLAMISYQFASHFFEMQNRMDRLALSMEATSSRLSYLINEDTESDYIENEDSNNLINKIF